MTAYEEAYLETSASEAETSADDEFGDDADLEDDDTNEAQPKN